MRKFGLSLARDGGYSKLLVVCASALSGTIFGTGTFLGVLTAQWKAEYALGQGLASIHQRLWLAFVFIGLSISSMLFDRLTPRKWLILGTSMSILGYSTLFALQFVPVAYFPIFQTVGGIVSGFGGGIGFANLVIAPQAWLDKTRSVLNPLLLLGAPIFSVVILTIGQYLIWQFTWPGALLLIISLVVHQYIIALIMMNHETYYHKEKVPINFAEYKQLLSIPCAVPYIISCCIFSGAISAGVYSDITNIAMECGIPQERAATIFIYCAISEASSRPVWSLMTKWLSNATCQILYFAASFCAQIALSQATTYPAFIVGLLIHSFALAGFSGLKTVIWIDIVGLKRA